MVWVPWANRTTDWTNALSSGKNMPDITELGNTDTPTEASIGILANISTDLNGLVGTKPTWFPACWPTTPRTATSYAVPWFGGVRGMWYRTDQFKAAGITVHADHLGGTRLPTRRSCMQKYPGTYGFGALTNYTNAFASFIWGAGGQVATETDGKWTADLTSPASRGGASSTTPTCYSPTRSRRPSTSARPSSATPARPPAGRTRTSRLGKLDMYIDGPWATADAPGELGRQVQLGVLPDPERRTGRPRRRPSPAAPTWPSGRAARTRPRTGTCSS